MVDWGFLEDPVLGSTLVMKDVILAAIIILFGLIMALTFPTRIARHLTSMFLALDRRSMKREGKDTGEIERRLSVEKAKYKKKVEVPLQRTLFWMYLILFAGLAYYSMGIKMDTTLRIDSRTFEVWRLMQWMLVNIIVIVFSLMGIDPILRAIVYFVTGSSMSKVVKYRLFKSLRFSSKAAVIVLGSYAAIMISFTHRQISVLDIIIDIHRFLLILFGAHIVANIAVSLMEPSFKINKRSGKDTGKAIGRLVKAGIYLLAALIAMLVLGLDPLTMATSLGLIGFALAFGLQDTVANFAAGIMIAIDRPFVIGDRIRILWGGQDTWGDVKDISLRSTWIKTPEEEMIVIPNNVIASSQVWNYTRESPKVVIQFDVGISYDSDWKLAETLILDILRSHPLVMNKPKPYVIMKEFGNSAIILKPWFWVPEARDKLNIQSDVLKRIKDAFDRNGVSIPFPHRTVVYHKDMTPPAKMTKPYVSPLYLPSTGFRRYKLQADLDDDRIHEEKVILAPTSASYAAKLTAPVVMDTASRMNASVAALFVRSHGGNEHDGQRALRIYNEVAKHYGVDIKMIFKEGDVLEKIMETVEEEGATLVMIGATEESMIGSITRKSVSQELLSHLNVPSMVIPFRASDEDRYREIVHSARSRKDNAPPAEGNEDFTSLSSLDELVEKGGP
ncbi:MAG: mechanosensitive ion channel [Candidatus Thermoplasmatota archaeon]|nr:mechanosensitive ion channel [Candidatus Thermoplasmatota archaeon]